MSDSTTPIPITPEMLAAARELFAGRIADCPFCGGFSKPNPRHSPVRYDPVICLAEARDTWHVRCFSCFACVSSTNTAAEAVERWNTRAGTGERPRELLPLVDLQKVARGAGVQLTPAVEEFAREVQRDVLRLNRRPL